MSYLVIARKFRPQSFASILGQAHVTRALANAIARDRVPHALLFTGPRGVGKTSCARVFARALNCSGRELPENLSELDEEAAREMVEPCGECGNCREIAKSSSIAVREVDGASNNSVDNVRELIESLRSLPPPHCKYKIYIIDEVHMLSTAAFNALLKSLEEPPPNTIFVFATTEPHKIPETVVSRCQRHDFRALTPQVIAEQLAQIALTEEIDVEEDVLRLIARKAQGGMRDAQSMFDRLIALSAKRVDLDTARHVFGSLDEQFFCDLSRAVFARDPGRCFELLDNAFQLSLDLRSFVADFVSHWRSLLVVGLTKKATDSADDALASMLQLGKSEIVELRELVSDVSGFDLQRYFDLAESTATNALASNFPRYVLEAGLAKMATLPSLRPLPELIDRLERIEGGGSAATAPRQPVDTPRPQAVPKRAVAPAAPSVEDSAPVPAAGFNPSWESFVSHVQSSSEVVLAAHLRRVSPRTFAEGTLVIGAHGFDYESLTDVALLKTLKSCLHSYSGIERWSVEVCKDEAPPPSAAQSKGTVAKGSIADQERRAKEAFVAKVDREARENPLTRAALETFKGSQIEKVTVLKS